MRKKPQNPGESELFTHSKELVPANLFNFTFGLCEKITNFTIEVR